MPHALPLLDLYRVTTPEGENNRALASSDNYKFYFGVAFDEDTTSNVVELDSSESKDSKFFVFFPPEYQMIPVADVVDGASQTEYDCSLYRQDAASGDLDETATTSVEDLKCKFNYEIDPLGNALEFSGLTYTFKNLDGTSYYDYVLYVKNVQNPFDGSVRASSELDVSFPDPTPYDSEDAIKW